MKNNKFDDMSYDNSRLQALFDIARVSLGQPISNVNKLPENNKALQVVIYQPTEKAMVIKSNNTKLTLDLSKSNLNHQKFLLRHNVLAFNSWQDQEVFFDSRMRRELKRQKQDMQFFLKNKKENPVSKKTLIMTGGSATLDESLKILEGDYVPQNYHTKLIFETSMMSIVVGFMLYSFQNIKIMGKTIIGHIREFIPEAILKPIDQIFSTLNAAKGTILAYTCTLELILLVDLISHYVGEINMADMYRQSLKDIIEMTGKSYQELLKVHIDDVTEYATKLEECKRNLKNAKASSNL